MPGRSRRPSPKGAARTEPGSRRRLPCGGLAWAASILSGSGDALRLRLLLKTAGNKQERPFRRGAHEAALIAARWLWAAEGPAEALGRAGRRRKNRWAAETRTEPQLPARSVCETGRDLGRAEEPPPNACWATTTFSGLTKCAGERE